MKELKFFKYTTVVLLVLNVSVVLFFVVTKPPLPVAADVKNAIEVLHLTLEQKREFHKLVMKHHKHMRGFNEREKALLTTYFNLEDSSTTDAQKQEVLAKIEMLHTKKLQNTYKHFNEVRQILTPEQLPYLKEFIENVMRQQAPEKKMPHPPKDFR